MLTVIPNVCFMFHAGTQYVASCSVVEQHTDKHPVFHWRNTGRGVDDDGFCRRYDPCGMNQLQGVILRSLA